MKFFITKDKNRFSTRSLVEFHKPWKTTSITTYTVEVNLLSFYRKIMLVKGV